MPPHSLEPGIFVKNVTNITGGFPQIHRYSTQKVAAYQICYYLL